MVDDHIPDEVLHNILARLPAKPLAWFRCVSKHWNHLITDPYFMKLISRRMILLSFQPLLAVDDNIPAEDKGRSLVKLDCPYGDLKGTNISIVGTFNGIVLLLLKYFSAKSTFEHTHKLILYNPFTGESKMLPEPPSPIYRYSIYTFGFGYGTTSDDLKIVRFRNFDDGYRTWGNCDVFDLKNYLWDNTHHVNIEDIRFRHDDVGRFLNGFLYWIAFKSNDMVIVAFNVKEMTVSSDIHIPRQCSYVRNPLGTMHGRLCIMNKIDVGFEVWMMKEQGVENSWYKAHTFVLRLEGSIFNNLFPISILDSGNILLNDNSCQLIIYNIAKGSQRKLINFSNPFSFTKIIHGVEYVKSLVSISNLCLV